MSYRSKAEVEREIAEALKGMQELASKYHFELENGPGGPVLRHYNHGDEFDEITTREINLAPF
jgi:hypothetical protein